MMIFMSVLLFIDEDLEAAVSVRAVFGNIQSLEFFFRG